MFLRVLSVSAMSGLLLFCWFFFSYPPCLLLPTQPFFSFPLFCNIVFDLIYIMILGFSLFLFVCVSITPYLAPRSPPAHVSVVLLFHFALYLIQSAIVLGVSRKCFSSVQTLILVYEEAVYDVMWRLLDSPYNFTSRFALLLYSHERRALFWATIIITLQVCDMRQLICSSCCFSLFYFDILK